MRRRHRPELSGPTGPLVGLATRVPAELHRRIRLVCVQADRPVQDFVADALREKLSRREVAPRRR